MLHRVKKVEYLSGYKLKLQFANGKFKVVDLQGMLKNAKNLFLQLKDLEYFKKVECDGYSICWPNGIDFCPDVLYKSGQDIPKEKRVSSKTSVLSKRRKKTTRLGPLKRTSSSLIRKSYRVSPKKKKPSKKS